MNDLDAVVPTVSKESLLQALPHIRINDGDDAVDGFGRILKEYLRHKPQFDGYLVLMLRAEADGSVQFRSVGYHVAVLQVVGPLFNDVVDKREEGVVIVHEHAESLDLSAVLVLPRGGPADARQQTLLLLHELCAEKEGRKGGREGLKR
jgi:hypothetical protein